MIGGHDRAWYERRLTGFGASEAPALLGLSRWKTARQVVEDKMRRIIPDPDAPDRLRLRVGRDMEPLLARYVVELAGERGLIRAGARFRRSNLLHRMAKGSFVIANADGFVDDALVELKTDDYGFEPWGDEDGDPTRVVPPMYYAQIQHALAATRRRRCLLLAMIGFHERKLYVVPADDGYIADLIDVETPLWSAVEEGRARLAGDPDAAIDDLLPAFEATRAGAAAIRKRYPVDDGLILPATAEQAALIARLRQAVADIGAAERVYAGIEPAVIAAIGEAAGLTSGHGTVTFKKAADGVSVDWPKTARLVVEDLLRFDEGMVDITDADIDRKLAPYMAAHTTTSPGTRRIYWPRSWKKVGAVADDSEGNG